MFHVEHFFWMVSKGRTRTWATTKSRKMFHVDHLFSKFIFLKLLFPAIPPSYSSAKSPTSLHGPAFGFCHGFEDADIVVPGTQELMHPSGIDLGRGGGNEGTLGRRREWINFVRQA
jgi:hypothetical protein